jgi:2-amino-4-hydroxy-6-hydroxymethyldihydropteridine diphosphokinase
MACSSDTFDTVGQQRAFFSLGTNLGDRAANLERATAELASHGVEVLRRSSIYETEPVDFLNQPWFLNCAAEAVTTLSPTELLDALQQIEKSMGSSKAVPKGPRLIDLDILFFGNQSVRAPGLEIPHPRMALRRFVLVPLAEIAPDFVHPVLKITVRQMLAATSDRSTVRLYFARE